MYNLIYYSLGYADRGDLRADIKASAWSDLWGTCLGYGPESERKEVHHTGDHQISINATHIPAPVSHLPHNI